MVDKPRALRLEHKAKEQGPFPRPLQSKLLPKKKEGPKNPASFFSLDGDSSHG